MLRKLTFPFIAVSALFCFSGAAHAQLSITAQPSTLTFTAPYAAQGFALSSSASTGVNITTNQTWLTVSITSSAFVPSVVAVNVNPGSLANGTYNGLITVTPTLAGVTGATVSVTMIVGTGGGGGGGGATSTVGVAPNALSFTSVSGSIPPTQSFNLTAPAGTSYTVSPSYASGFGWVTTTPASGATTGATTTINVNISPGNLTPGSYSAYVSVTIPNQPTQVVLISLTVGTASVTFSPNVVTFNYQPGGAVPGNQTFNMTTSSGTNFVLFPAQISGTTAGTWLSLPNSSGTTNPSATVSVGLSASVVQAMPAGTYFTVLTVAPVNIQTQYVLVVLNVGGTGGGGSGTGTGGVTFTPSSIVFSYTPSSGVFPGNQNFTISAPSALSVAVTSTTSTGGTWFSVGPTSATLIQSGATFSANFQAGVFSPTLLGLPIGTYQGSITVTQPGSTTVLATIPVTLNIGTTGGGGGATTGITAPSQMSFTYQGGQAAPPPQFLTLIPAGGVTTSFTATVQPVSGGTAVNWLQVSPGSGAAPGVAAVSIVNVGSLPPGTFNANINISYGGSATPVVVPVTLSVGTSPQLRFNLNSVTFNYQLGAGNPGQAQTIDVSSTGGSINPVSFTAAATPASGSNWLTVTPSSGQTPTTISVGVNATALAAGTYTGTVTLTYSGGTASIPVTLNVSAQPLLNVNPLPPVVFNYTVGSSLPVAQVLTVSSTGVPVTVTPAVSMTTGTGWLSATPIQTANTPYTLQVFVSPAGLTEGTYYGAVTVTPTAGSAGNSPLVLPVVLNVSSSSNLVITPAPPLNFTQFQGSAPPAAQTLNVASSGGLLSYTVTTSIFSGGNWLAITPTSGITPSQIQVSVNGQGLPSGAYAGSIIIASQGATNSPQVIPVNLSVVSPPTVSATPTSITFNANTNGVITPASQAIQLASSGANLSFSVQASVSQGTTQWLTVTPTTGTTPASLNVVPSVANLQPGTYNGTITINTGLPAPITIPVTLNFVQVNPPQVNAVTSSASALPTAVSPGMIVAIYGSNLGPTTLVRLRTTSAGTVDTNLEGVRVLFDGIPAPMVFARNDVVSAIVPYAMGGRASTKVQIEYQGARSRELDVRVVDYSPALFTTNQQGTGQGAIQNNDFSTNSPTNPVARGQFAIIYITGEGQTSPAGVDGVISSGSLLRNPIGQVQVRIGGRPAQVLYAGSVPTVVLGLAQVNVIVPADAPTGGSVPVEVIVGGVSSQPNVTMSVR